MFCLKVQGLEPRGVWYTLALMQGGRWPRSAFQTVAVVGVVGFLLGVAAYLGRPLSDVPTGPARPSPDASSAFAAYFMLFSPGRKPDGSLPSRNDPLLPATKFIAGERVGLRVQTASGLRRALFVELRFLTEEAHEELPALRDDRQSFHISPGLKTYCCLRIPEEPGRYRIGVLVNENFVAFLPARVEESPYQREGGLFSQPKE